MSTNERSTMSQTMRDVVSHALVAYGALPYHPGKWRVVDIICAWFGLHQNPPQPAVTSRHGFRFDLEPKYYIDRTLFYLRSWEGRHTRFVENYLRPGMVAIDAGANIGWYTLAMARAVKDTGMVYAFEPALEELTRLTSNVQLNEMKNVRIKPLALASGVGQSTLSDTLDSGATYVGGGKRPIRTTSIDQLVSDERLTRVDFIKMDVEGSELQVLLGARDVLRRFKPLLMVALEDTPLSRMGIEPQTVIAHLRAEGYELKELVGGKLVPARDGAPPRNAFAVHSNRH
jgi:FkbM family methyltransferase